ncbi:MAG: DegT/DnrJ/EryC1/StrS family aminotransferase [Nitrospirae bacterium]|nr:DegT/DnrJ/EryC1/StrS family aminotransferase [Nitrospirota bacterium]MBU6482663.1 DegT/DnrJ/EryC1/StrS family aminotransferase [Nitrospirota bacterium]
MIPQRTLSPTAAPISLWDLVRAGGSLCGGAKHRARLIQELKTKFSAREVFLVSSGKAALTVILKALAASSGRRRVIIPAYTCFSVPSAIVKAGLEVVLCDVEPETLDFNFAELEGLINEEVLSIVPTHLFGRPADVDRVKRLCEGKGIVVVEDAAQAMGGQSGGRLLGTLGDVAFFSLGRGKNLTCGTGGIILTRSLSIAEKIKVGYATLPEAPRNEVLRNWLEMMMMRFFIHPLLYWLPAGLPFLRLGETKFYTDFPICRMDEVRAHQLQGWERRLAQANQERMTRAKWLIDGLDLQARGIKPITGKEAIYLRLPVLLRDRETKEAVCRQSREEGAGVSQNYPATIQEIPELAGRLVSRKCAGAQDVVDRLVTLPTHQFVKKGDRLKIDRVLGSQGSRSAPTVSGDTETSDQASDHRPALSGK